MLETVEDVCTEAFIVVGILLVGDFLDENGGIEVDERARHTLTTVFREVDRREGTIRTIALADHRHTTPATRMGIEVIGLLACGFVFHLHEVRRKHRVPLTIDIPGEDRSFVAPLGEILDRSRPHANITTTIGGIVRIVRADDVGTQFARIVGILEDTRLTVGHMFPQRQIRILGADTQRSAH